MSATAGERHIWYGAQTGRNGWAGDRSDAPVYPKYGVLKCCDGRSQTFGWGWRDVHADDCDGGDA